MTGSTCPHGDRRQRAPDRDDLGGNPGGRVPDLEPDDQRSRSRHTDRMAADHSAPTLVEDPNGNVTTYQYDRLGRTWGVRLPTEQGTSVWSWQFAYQVDLAKAAPPIVRSRQLQAAEFTGDPATWFTDGWVIYDSFGRERQDPVVLADSGQGHRANHQLRRAWPGARQHVSPGGGWRSGTGHPRWRLGEPHPQLL